MEERVHCRTPLRPWGVEKSEQPKGAVPLTAEWGWPAKAKGDHHQCMNGDTFMCWTTQQLVPSVEAMCPPEDNPRLLGFVHVEDNAPCHHTFGQGRIPINNVTKMAVQQTGERTPSSATPKEAAKHGSNCAIKKGENVCVTI